MNVQELKKTANQVRKNIVTAVYYAKAGHPGGSLSAADIYTYLYMEEMNVDPAKPADPDRTWIPQSPQTPTETDSSSPRDIPAPVFTA